MLQHPATDFYDLAAANAAAVLTARHTPPYSPTGLSGSVVALHNNNNNSTSNNNNNNLDMLTHNGGGVGVGLGGGVTATGLHLSGGGSNGGPGAAGGGSAATAGRETLPSFGFTQEQVACVCEVSCCWRGLRPAQLPTLSYSVLCFRCCSRRATSKDWAASFGRCHNVINCN